MNNTFSNGFSHISGNRSEIHLKNLLKEKNKKRKKEREERKKERKKRKEEKKK